MSNIYKGRGTKADEKQLIGMLDDVFFGDDTSEHKPDFMSLLPKLYKDKYNPGYNNVIVKEGSEIKAAVGCYPHEVVAAGRKLKVMGIGNVAVAKDSRRKGYMIDLMNMALDIMKEGDYDYSLLGGQRQRYGYFGYEPAGYSHGFTTDRGNIRRLLGADAKSGCTVKEVTEADTETIRRIKAIHESAAVYSVRSEEMTVDILKSWRNVPYAVFEGEEFKGYFIASLYGKEVCELKAEKAEDTLKLILSAMEFCEKEQIHFCLPVFDGERCDYMAKICENSAVYNTDMVNVFNYRRFIEAFLAVKAARVNLCGGTLNMLIHGYKADESLAVTVDGKNVTVCETDAKPDIELGHNDAIRFLTGLFSKERFDVPAFAQSWFPLDFYAAGSDNA